MKVLFISQWYPHRYDSMEGLFVQKHATASALYCDVKVIFVHAVKNINTFEVVRQKYEAVTEYIVYYPAGKENFFGKIEKTINYLRAYKMGFDLLRKENWKPDILHANVLTRTPLIAYLYKIKTKTPYVITEHWTRLLKAQSNFDGFFRVFIAKIVVKNAASILPVSTILKEGIEYHNLLLTKCEVVENVVDTCFYESYPIIKNDKKQLMNVTCFFEQHKNLFGLLRAVKAISKTRTDFQLSLVGTGKDYEITYNYYKSLDFPEGTVIFTGLKTSQEVAEMMHNADAIVQFSNYETAGVVIQEALVSGKPVISTKVGIAPDFICDKNGILVDVGDENQLITAIQYILDNLEKYNSKEIMDNAKNAFSYETIGKKHFEIYKEGLK